MAPHRSPGGWRGPVALLVATFVASRLWFRAAGVRFDDGPLQYYWQYVEVELLRTRLAESVLHLHSQPPLFNLPRRRGPTPSGARRRAAGGRLAVAGPGPNR